MTTFLSDPAVWISSLALVVSIASLWWARRRYILEGKRDVLRRLMGSAHVLTVGAQNLVQSRLQIGDLTLLGEPYISLNEAAFIFAEDADVVDKLNVFKRNVSQTDNVIPLLRAMAKASGTNLSAFTDEYFRFPFAPVFPSRQQPPIENLP